MQLDIESLRTLAAVVDTGGMTRAAEQLATSQSAVSWRIKRLEERIGRNLLVRNGRSIRASRDGEELLRYARTILDTHDEAVARLTGSQLSGTIRLGATEEVSAHLLSPVIGRFNRIHPDLTIEIQIDTSLTLEERLARGRLDLVLIQTEPDDRRAGDTVLWVDEQRWISSPEWTYDEGPVPLVTFGDQGFYRARAQRVLRQAGIRSSVAFSGPSTASVIAAVEAGLGVAALSGRSVAGEVIDWPRGETLDPLKPVNQVARLAPGETSPEVAELLADLQRVLGPPGSAADWAGG
ncbi:MAG: LysR substrate-binding domain-containing protein [Actinomycetota bacterium]